MKRCPECRRDYVDDSLLYCLDDGVALLDGPAYARTEEPVTVSFPDARRPTESQSASIGRDDGPENSGDEPATAVLRAGSSSHNGPTRSDPGEAGDIASANTRRETSPAYTRTRTLLAALGILALIAGVFFAYRFLAADNARQIESVAVMPFVNGSGNPDLEYLSDGMTETLISSLSQLPNLNVKARSSVFRYKGKEIDLKTIGSELSVQALLNGRVVQRGQDLILNVELIDSRTENVLWSQNYNRRITDLVSLQTEIARDVSGKLVTRLSGAERQKFAKEYTADTEAYNLYLRGRFHFNRRRLKDVQRAIEYLQQAVGKDPNYALAYTGLADAYAVLPGYSGQPAIETAPRAREAALRALSLDDNLSEAHASLAFLMNGYDYDFLGSEREFKRAIELDSRNAAALVNYGSLLVQLGRFDEGLDLIRRGLELEPLSLPFNRVYGHALYQARRYKESEEHLKKTVDLDPSFVLAHYTLSNVYNIQRKHAESAESYARGLEASGNLERANEARKSFREGGWRAFERFRIENVTTIRPRFLAAGAYAQLGEKDRAFQELERAIAERGSFVTLMKVDPILDPLRGDPRFDELVKKVGFPN